MNATGALCYCINVNNMEFRFIRRNFILVLKVSVKESNIWKHLAQDFSQGEEGVNHGERFQRFVTA